MNKTRNGWNLNNNCGCSTVKTSPHVALLRGLTWNQHLCTEHKHLWLDHDDLELYETETGEVLAGEGSKVSVESKNGDGTTCGEWLFGVSCM